MTFRVMNKVMNNFKRLGNSTFNELVNENVTHPFRPKNSKNPRCLTLRGFFFVLTIQCLFNVVSMSGV